MTAALLALSLSAVAVAKPAPGTAADLWASLGEIADRHADDDDVRSHWQRLVAAHGLADTPSAYAEFVRVRLAHETFRAGGWAGLRWTVTDQPPSSVRIWAAWGRTPTGALDAECDELSAIFAVAARELGVDQVGLFWPTWNHTVAVWTTPGSDGEPARVVVPTSQVFLTPQAGLGDSTFDPWSQRRIYHYGADDLPADTVLPEALSARILTGAETHGGSPEAELVRLRISEGW